VDLIFVFAQVQISGHPANFQFRLCGLKRADRAQRGSICRLARTRSFYWLAQAFRLNSCRR
jgi:hypothetical protein